ncbi:hypothetical protein DQM28_01290 [Leptospira mayottensis]|uniref:Uncharacterized protein n=1 Tax=Leptospira mayottensis TaxID=1137606 RepID=A0ABM6Y5J8_9LEPT|nr:hypothetical protein DQM28_01290 [Leptospira mayottensis]
MAFLNSKRKASHTPALIHCAPNVEPLNLKSNDLWTIPSKDDSDGNIGAEGESNTPRYRNFKYSKSRIEDI